MSEPGGSVTGGLGVYVPPPAMSQGASYEVALEDMVLSSTTDSTDFDIVSGPDGQVLVGSGAISEAITEPSVKRFLVVSVALATVCFFTNVVQVSYNNI